MGITYGKLLELAGGIRDGHHLKFFTPGGSSTPILTADDVDTVMDYEGVVAKGSILGTKALQTYDETVSVVRTCLRYTEFYQHESCGKCTPCREGSWWLVQTLRNLEAGKGTEGDVDKLLDVCDNVSMKSFCTLADGFVANITSSIKHFRSEFEAGYHTPAWELFPYERASTSRHTVGNESRLREVPSEHRRQTQAGNRIFHHRRQRSDRAQGHAGHTRRRGKRNSHSAFLRPPAARPGGLLPRLHG